MSQGRSPESKREVRWLILLVLLAAALRVYWAIQPRVVWGDEPFYLWIGQSLLDGHGYQFFSYSGSHFAPLYPLLAAAIARPLQLFGLSVPASLEIGSETVYVLAGALLVLPTFGIARRLVGAASAWAAGLVTALLPPLVSGVLLWGTMTEPLFLLLVACAWWGLLVALQEGRWWAFVAAGDALALAYLVRTEALVYLIAGMAAFFLLVLVFHGRARFLGALGGLVMLLAAFCLLISPYLVAQYVATGKLQLTEEAGFAYTSMEGLVKGDIAAFDDATWGIDPASGEVRLFAPASEDANLVGAILANPRGFVRLLRSNLIQLIEKAFGPKLLSWPLALLAVLGLFVRPWDRRSAAGHLLLAALLAGPLSFVLFFVQERYLAGAAIPFAVWIGAGLGALGEWLVGSLAALRKGADGEDAAARATPHAGRAANLLFIAPALLVAAWMLWQQPRLWTLMQQTNSFQPGHPAAAAELLAQGAKPMDVVLSRYPAVAFHAGTRWAATPAAIWPEVAYYAQLHGARYLVIDGWETQLRPSLRPLLDPTTAPAELAHVATLHAGSSPVLIYRWR